MSRIMWERHPDFRVARGYDCHWQIQAVTPQAIAWFQQHVPTTALCDPTKVVVLDPEMSRKLGRAIIENGFELGDLE